MPKFIFDNGVLIERLPSDPRLHTCPDAGRWRMGDRAVEDLVHHKSASGRRGERAMILED